MKCNNCASEWNSVIKTERCPFCGESLLKKPNDESMEAVLKYIVDTRGVGVYSNPSSLTGMLSDLLPGAADERRLVKFCIETEAVHELFTITQKEAAESEIICRKVSKYLQEHCFLNQMMADKFVYWVSYSLGCTGQKNYYETEQKSIFPKPEGQILKLHKLAKAAESRMIVSTNVTLALNTDGTVTSTKPLNDKYNIFVNGMDSASSWTDIASIHKTDSSDKHIVGLKKDGTVLVTRGKYGSADADDFAGSKLETWTGIKEIVAANKGFYGIRNDSTVLAAIKYPDYLTSFYGGEDKTEHLRDIKKILYSGSQMICLKYDGTLCATEYVGKKDHSIQWDEIRHWQNIDNLMYISGRMIGVKNDGSLIASSFNDLYKYTDFWPYISNEKNLLSFYWSKNELVALTEEGSIVYVGTPEVKNTPSYFKDMRNWKNIVNVYFGVDVAAGLCADGTVVVTNYYRGDKGGKIWKEIASWTDIIGLVPGFRRIIGIKKDGTLVHTGANDHGQGNVGHFRMFHNIDELMC